MVKNRLVVISGCSGGGKSTLLAELNRRGFTVIGEPGRRVVDEAQRDGGAALPWIDMTAFLFRTLEKAREDYLSACNARDWIFCDRGIVDAASGLQHFAGEPLLSGPAAECRYHRRVFLTPPWPEIYVCDAQRRHDFAAASAEYARLVVSYGALGYALTEIPRLAVAGRADFILRLLNDERI